MLFEDTRTSDAYHNCLVFTLSLANHEETFLEVGEQYEQTLRFYGQPIPNGHQRR